MKGPVLNWVNGLHGVNVQLVVEVDSGRKPDSVLITAINFTMRYLAILASQC